VVASAQIREDREVFSFFKGPSINGPGWTSIKDNIFSIYREQGRLKVIVYYDASL
jgi:hypothetical protein